MSRKLTKFEKIQDNIEKIIMEYKEAKNINDEMRMRKLQEEYEDQKVLLYSNEAYFKKLNKTELKSQREETHDNKKIKNIDTKLKQKKIYSDNKSYIDMIEKSETIDQYIKNASHKKRNFIKRNFKKIVLGISLTVALITGGSLLSKKNNKDEIKDNMTTIETTVDNTENYKNKEDYEINSTEVEEKLELSEEQNTESFPEQTKEESTSEVIPQNPNIDDSTETPTTEEIIIPESTTEEPEPEDYVPSTEESTTEENEDETDEIVTTEEEPTPDYPEEIDETDDTTEENTTEESTTEENEDETDEIVTTEEEPTPDYPEEIDETDDTTEENTTEENTTEENEDEIDEIITTEEEPIPDYPEEIDEDDDELHIYSRWYLASKKLIEESKNNNEKVTIIELEESEPLDNPTKIESDEKDIIYYDENGNVINKPSAEEIFPIEGEEIIYYENPDVVEEDHDIIDFMNNKTEIGKTYTFHM